MCDTANIKEYFLFFFYSLKTYSKSFLFCLGLITLTTLTTCCDLFPSALMSLDQLRYYFPPPFPHITGLIGLYLFVLYSYEGVLPSLTGSSLPLRLR